MLNSHLTLALRFLRKDKVTSAVNLLGLTIGLGVCLLLAVHVQRELEHAHFHSKGDRVFRVLQRSNEAGSLPTWQPHSDGGITAVVAPDIPEVASATRYLSWGMWVRHGDRILTQRVCLADVQLFDMFDLHLLQGDPRQALAEPGTMVITRSAALRYLGDRDPVGKVFTVDDHKMGGDYVITGVVRDIPPSSQVSFDFMTASPPAGSPPYFSSQAWEGWREQWYPFTNYFLLAEGASPARVEARLDSLIALRKGATGSVADTYRLQRLDRIHLHSRADFGIPSSGDIRFLRVLCLIGLCVLLSAGVNYVNLATAISTRRFQEVGLRKVIGAGRRPLLAQFAAEALVSSLIALLLAFLLAWAAMPLFDRLVDGVHSPSALLSSWVIGGMCVLALVVGLVSGAYPAILLSRLPPTAILRASSRGGRTAWVRKGLVVFQFAVSIALIISTLVIYRQTDYLASRDLGLDQEHVVSLPLFLAAPELGRRYEMVKERFLEHPGVLSATAIWPVPGLGTETTHVRVQGHEEEWEMLIQGIDSDFLETFRIDLVTGRNADVHSDTKAATDFLLNETAVRMLGWEDPVGKSIEWQDFSGHVVGVVADYHSNSLHSPVRPTILFDWQHAAVVLRLAPGDREGTMAFLEQTWQSFVPGRPLEVTFVDRAFAQSYGVERRRGRTYAVLSGLAVSIASLDLFGLSVFVARQRTREVSIRRVLGAPVSSLLLLLTGESFRAVLLANVVAWPVAWLAMRDWLQGYPYTVDLGPALFVQASLFVLLLAVLTSLYHALQAAIANPAETLRRE